MVEVKRKKGEAFDSLLRRFQRRMQQGGVSLQARKQRFRNAKQNKNARHRSALRREQKRVQYDYLMKTGQLKDDKR